MNFRLFSTGITLIKKSNLFARSINTKNNKNKNGELFGLNLYEIGDMIQESPINKKNKQFNVPSNASIIKKNKKNKINNLKLLDMKTSTKDFPLL